MPFHVSKEQFAGIVEQVLSELPAQFMSALDEVTVEVRDRPSRKLLRSMGMRDDDLLLGLHTGRPITMRSVNDTGALPDQILIFQEDCELVSETQADLIREVRTTVLHELGHHFGLDEDDLHRLGYG